MDARMFAAGKAFGYIGAAIGFVAVILMVVAVYGLGACVIWNDWGANLSSWFHAEDLTFKQAAGVGMMIFALRFRLPKATGEADAKRS